MNKEKIITIIKGIHPDKSTAVGVLVAVSTIATVIFAGKLITERCYHTNRENTLKALVKSYRTKNRELIDKLNKVEGCLFEE